MPVFVDDIRLTTGCLIVGPGPKSLIHRAGRYKPSDALIRAVDLLSDLSSYSHPLCISPMSIRMILAHEALVTLTNLLIGRSKWYFQVGVILPERLRWKA